MPTTQKHFTDTIFYQVELTARYTKMLGAQLFGKLGIGLTPEEFSVLDTLIANDSLCQSIKFAKKYQKFAFCQLIRL